MQGTVVGCEPLTVYRIYGKVASMTGEEAARSIDYQLSYKKSRMKRAFHEGGITGEQITNAYNTSEKGSGEWVQPTHPDWDDPHYDWLAHFFRCAINEGVHEVLEWFRLDGRPMLDPHGDRDTAIYRLVDELADKLYELT